MRSLFTPSRVLPSTWFRFLIISLLALGIFFRFTNLDQKIYWMDETYTSLRISGYTEAEVAQQLLEGQILDIHDLHQYQRLNPNKNVFDAVKGLAAEEPQVAPLYFVMLRFWVQLWGNSITVIRSFSAFLSVLALPCMYWLCLELFESSLVGWLGSALLAISPFQLVYGQEARQYSLWTVAILLSSASLLRAIRVNTWRSWGIYTATIIIGLYSHLFFVLVAIAQALYVFTLNNWRWSKNLKAYLLSSIIGIIAFSPWIGVILTNFKQGLAMTAAQGVKISLPYYLKSWLGNLSRNFLDTGFSSSSPFGTPIPILAFLSLSILLIFALVVYSLYFLFRHTPKQTWLYVFILIGFTSLIIIIPDLILGRRTSVTGRYMIPSFLGVQLSVAYLLASRINPSLVKNWQNKFWRIILALLLTSGVISCIIISQSETWWNNLTDTQNGQLAQIINQSQKPLIIQEIDSSPPRYNVFNLISLSYLLKSDVKFKFIPKDTVTNIPTGFSTVFFMGPSKVLKSGIEKKSNVKIKPLDKGEDSRLWKLVKPPKTVVS